MDTQEKLRSLIEDYISKVAVDRKPAELYDPIIYTLAGGGKRIRPVLMLMTAGLYTDNVENALPAAVAIEVFHNFTLLHDDIMDNAEVRRGKPSVVKKWNPNTAILSGDAMVILAYKLLEEYPAEQLCAILPEFSRMAAEICEGQQYDMNFEKRDDVTLDEYKDMIHLKTAVIFGLAAKLGAIIGGASKEDCDNLYDFGIEIGMAFQVQDDYLDTYGTQEILGKEIGGDIAESKKTFLAINALNEAGAATGRALLATFADTKLPLAHKINRVKTIYDSLDIPAITRSIIDKHLENATALLGRLDVAPDKLCNLQNLVETISKRNK